MASDEVYARAKTVLTEAGHPDLLESLLKKIAENKPADDADVFAFLQEQVQALKPKQIRFLIFVADPFSHELASVVWSPEGGFENGPRVPAFAEKDWAGRSGVPDGDVWVEPDAFVTAATAAEASDLVFVSDSRTGSGYAIAKIAFKAGKATQEAVLRVHTVVGLPDVETFSGASCGGPIAGVLAAHTVSLTVLSKEGCSATFVPPRVFDGGEPKQVVEVLIPEVAKVVAGSEGRILATVGAAEALPESLVKVMKTGLQVVSNYSYKGTRYLPTEMFALESEIDAAASALDAAKETGTIKPLGLPSPAPGSAENPLPLPHLAPPSEGRPRVHLLCDGPAAQKLASAVAPWPAHVTLSAVRDAPTFDNDSYADVVLLIDATNAAAAKRLSEMKFTPNATVQIAVLLMPSKDADKTAWAPATLALHASINIGSSVLITAPKDDESAKKAAAALGALLDIVERRSAHALLHFHSPHFRQDIACPYFLGSTLEAAAGPLLPAAAALLDTTSEEHGGARTHGARSIVIRTENNAAAPAIAAAASRVDEEAGKRQLVEARVYGSAVTFVKDKPRSNGAAGAEVIAFASHTPEVLGALHGCVQAEGADPVAHSNIGDLISEIGVQLQAAVGSE